MFRLHQLIAGAGDLFGTLEPAGVRYLTLNGQQYQPDAERSKRLFPFCFCRECGQEYVPVWATRHGKAVEQLERRELGERIAEDDAAFGFFMPDPDGRFDPSDVEASFPEDWLQSDGLITKLKAAYRKLAPEAVRVNPLGEIDQAGLPGWFMPGSFRFCLNPDCRVFYDGSVRSDLTKLSSLSTEGRSSATTILTLATLRYMLEEGSELPERARKLLGFTDNRQDASLQAGHFNDFVQILLLRGALLAAIEQSDDRALTDETLTQRVMAQLQLRDEDFASNPGAKGIAAEDTRRALRDVLGYRLYQDLRRGWRITNPNLEQLGLLAIDYRALDACCNDEEVWSTAPPLLARATPAVRAAVARELLDTLRRQLCIKTRYLDRLELEQIRNRSHTSLKEPWGLTEDERELQTARAFVPGPRPSGGEALREVEFGSLEAVHFSDSVIRFG